jgi:tetratricopeptide (TPR) repeat protein
MLKKKLNAKTEARLQEIMRRGHGLEKLQRFDEAAAEYQKVLDIDRDNIPACQLLGMLRHKLGQNALAEPLLAKVVKAFPRKADLQCAYGAVLSATGDHRKSSVYYRKALEIDPDYLIAQYNLGQELMYLGETEAAIAGYRRALEISPLCAPAYQQLARLCKFVEYNEDVHIMEQLYEQFEGDDRVLLAFGLSVVHRKLGNFERSFDYLLKGNSLHRTSLDYSTARTEATFNEMRQAFNAEILARPVEPTQRELTPIFIIGMPRSGTSLAEQILASHSAVHGCGELKNLTILHKNSFSESGSLVDQVANLSPGRRREMAQQYLDEIALMAKGKRYATDKMPHNFLLVGMIADLFPNARIIHCERNPMDTCFSIFTNLFTGVHSYAYQLDELGHYHLLYQQLMAHWYEVLPGRIYTLNYERMVADTEGEVRKLLDFCELPFEAGCLTFFENERAVVTASNTQIRQPIYTSSVEGWRKFEQGLAPLRAILEP